MTYFQKMLATANDRKNYLLARQSHLPAIISALQSVANGTADKLVTTYTDELATIPDKITEVQAVIDDLND